MVNLQKIEEKRLVIYAEYNMQKKKGILFLIPGILFFISLGISPIFVVLSLVFFVVAITYFSKAFHLNKDFRNIIKKEVVTTLLEEQFDDMIYDQNGFIPVSKIIASGMVRKPDRSKLDDYIKGSYKGVNFEVCDLDFEVESRSTDSKGHTSTSYHTYFKGRWYIYTFQHKFDEELKIIEGSRWQIAKKNLVQVDTESIEFNNKFSIYATSQTYGFYHITPIMIEKLLELEKMHRGSILYYFVNDQLHIGVNDSKDYMEISLKTKINPDSLIPLISDIELIPKIIDQLGLNTSKFNRNL